MSSPLVEEIVLSIARDIVQPLISPPPAELLENYDFQDGTNYDLQDGTNLDFN